LSTSSRAGLDPRRGARFQLGLGKGRLQLFLTDNGQGDLALVDAPREFLDVRSRPPTPQLADRRRDGSPIRAVLAIAGEHDASDTSKRDAPAAFGHELVLVEMNLTLYSPLWRPLYEIATIRVYPDVRVRRSPLRSRKATRMDYVKLGSTGLDVSRICLGCMSFGEPQRGGHPWSLGEEDSRVIIRFALEAGINFFDTANVYSDGSSEEIVGRALADFGSRDQVVLATKLHGRMHEGPNGAGLSRKAVMSEIDKSLVRLGTDYVDLYQIHRFDPATPVEETVEALHDVVRSGKARYVGASSMYAWQFAKMLHVADGNGWTRFVSMQDHYNLLYREEEREMLPLCEDEGIGVIPWSPLARGRLTRDWSEVTERSAADEFGKTLYNDADRPIVEAVAEIAAERGISRARVALAWLHHQPVVTAPIVGATRLTQLEDALASVDVELTAEEIERLEEPYKPHSILGHS
jgi:aryl-alcohol dehydrogenase-like predicted oxidoreductase